MITWLIGFGQVFAQTNFTYDAAGNRLTKAVIGQAAVASLSGSQTVSSGQPASLTIALTGVPPWSLTVVGSSPIVFSGIATSPFICTVTPASSTTYTLSSVQNSCGPGTLSGTAYVAVLIGNCTVMFTVKDGLWSDPTVWSCNRVPISTDPVTLNHAVTIPINYVGTAQRVLYSSGARLLYGLGSLLRIGF
ncbi:hypothetical protein F5984_26230 [Rudanella paleaurantiibacter]|uniref:Uncharacterized protein n=1 Tax=Rudanella paleaurantiibacter TaxID=2614655 RepID=A0A7J5TRU4_9BACT|nr:hypothetical protein F5984_26230 [Rudanella paleaurantiibacter]